MGSKKRSRKEVVHNFIQKDGCRAGCKTLHTWCCILQLSRAKKFDFKRLAVRFRGLNGRLCEGLFFYPFFRQPPAEAGAAGFAEDGERRQAVEIPKGVQFVRGGEVQGGPAGEEKSRTDEKLPRLGQIVFEEQTHIRLKVSAIRKKMSLTGVISLDKNRGGGNFKQIG